MKYVCEHIKSYLFQLAAPFVGKCHLFYYDVWRIKGMRKMDFLFVRLALKKKKTLIIYLTISVFGGEPLARLELATYALRMRCSTNWAIAAMGFRLRGAKVHLYLNLQKELPDFLEIFLSGIFSIFVYLSEILWIKPYGKDV